MPNTVWSLTYSLTHTCTHRHTGQWQSYPVSSHRTLGKALVHYIHGQVTDLTSNPHHRHPMPHPTDVIYHCRLDFWETQAHVGATETPKYGARTPNRPSIPKKKPLVLGVSWNCCRELTSQVQKRPLAPKYLPSQETPSPIPLRLTAGTGSHLKF